jgi:hypothetical protein
MISPSLLEHHLEIRRGPIGRLRRASAVTVDGIDEPITIRAAAVQDGPAIARLAVLDGHTLPAGEQLVAEADGRIVAAAEVTSGKTVADPFRPSAGAARLVALRAKQLRPRPV